MRRLKGAMIKVNTITNDMDKLKMTLLLNSWHLIKNSWYLIKTMRYSEALDVGPMKRATFINERGFSNCLSLSCLKVITEDKYINLQLQEGLKSRGHK